MALGARKSSARVTLVLIGVAALAGCGRSEEQHRDIYASREDCLADWGNKPEDCQPATNPVHFNHGYFYGPAYTYRGGPESGWMRATHAVGQSSSRVSRGGFGHSGRSGG